MRNNKVIVSGISANSPVYLTDDGKKGRTVIAPFLIREELEKVRTKPQTDSEE